MIQSVSLSSDIKVQPGKWIEKSTKLALAGRQL